MKFAAAALLATVSARPSREDLIENVRVHYPAETVRKFAGLGKELEQAMHDAEK